MNRRAGIEAWGHYLPRTLAHKSPQPDVAARTAASWDEDTFTMGVEAGRECLRMRDRHPAASDLSPIEAVFTIRSAEPYEGGVRPLLTALGLGDEVRMIELPAGDDGPADALDLALAQVGSAALRSVLVIGASCHPRPGESEALGDGAAAVIVGSEPLFESLGVAFANLGFFWSGGAEGQLVPKRFEQREVAGPGLRGVTERALNTQGWAGAQIDAWSLSSPAGHHLARELELDPGPLGEDQPYSYATGADLLIRLAALCDSAKAEDRLLAVNLGERAHAFLWRASAELPARAGTAYPAPRWIDYAAYTLAAKSRELSARQDIDPMDYLREADAVLRLEGSRCRSCARVMVMSSVTSGAGPFQGRCDECGGPVEPVALARRGSVRSFTRSHMEDGEPTTYVICDLDGGGRLLLELADPDDDTQVEIGDRVRLALRRGYREQRRTLYLWKAVAEHG